MSIKFGVIGLGALGGSHFKSLMAMKDVQVTAICDVRPEKMCPEGLGSDFNIQQNQGAAAQIGDIRKHKDYRRVIRDESIQAVCIATPTYLHPKMTIQALQAGKHVFTEKPMGLRASDARKMIQAAQQSGKLLQVGHVLRFWPEYVMMKEMIDSARYGKVLSATFTRLGGFPAWSWENWFLNPRLSGGAAFDLHIHDVDVINWFFGPPQKVSATGVTDSLGGVNHITVQYQYADVPMVFAEGGWLNGPCPFSMSARLQFEQATVEYDSAGTPTLSVYRVGEDKVENPDVPQVGAYSAELEYFVSCLTGGKPNERVPAGQAAMAVAIVAAEVKSIKTHRAIAVKGFQDKLKISEFP
jgi:predicted dehydrogenase